MRKKRNFLPVVMTALILFGGMETLASDRSVDAAKKAFILPNTRISQAMCGFAFFSFLQLTK